MTISRCVVATLLMAASLGTLVADARERGFVRAGMAEGEVLFKVGKPDHEAFVAAVKGKTEEKTWTYFPHARDPQTLTVFTIRGGVVTNIERKIVR